MAKSKSFAVFGMGRFGKKLALSLYDAGLDVMVVDKNPDLIEELSDCVTYAIEADVSKADALKGIGLEDIDVVVVAMGTDLTSSIMSVMVSKELGVPYVLAKASDERMGAILTKVGADKVIFPEEESGLRNARILMSDSFLEFFNIDDTLCLLEMKPLKDWIGKNLKELNLRQKYRANVVAIKVGNKTKAYVDPEVPLAEDNQLLVIVDKADLKRLRD